MFAWSDCCCCCCCWSAGDVTLGWRQQLPPPWQVVAQEWRIMPKNPSLSFHFLGRMSQHGFFLAVGRILWGFAEEKGETLAAGSFALGGREGGGRARNQQWNRPLLTIYCLSSILSTLAPYYSLCFILALLLLRCVKFTKLNSPHSWMNPSNQTFHLRSPGSFYP